MEYLQCVCGMVYFSSILFQNIVRFLMDMARGAFNCYFHTVRGRGYMRDFWMTSFSRDRWGSSEMVLFVVVWKK